MISVGTFNLRNATYDTEPPRTWDVRKSVAAGHAIRAGVSLIALQECSAPTDPNGQAQQFVNEINSQLGTTTWRVLVGSAGIALAIAYDSAVVNPTTSLSRVVIEESSSVSTPRSLVYATFVDSSSTRFVFGSTHWLSGAGEDADSRRVVNAQRTGEEMSRLERETGLPVIVGGDFNTGTYSSGSPRNILETSGYKSLARSYPRVNGQYNSFNNFDPSMVGRQNGNWIDGLHSSPSVTAARVTMHLEFASGSSLPLSTPLPSDHNLIVAPIEIPQPRSTSEIAPGSNEKWPPRNLGRAEHWGRTVERRVDAMLAAGGMIDQKVSGYDRYSSSSAQTLSQNANDILELAASIEQAILVTPRYFTRNISANNFAVGTGWGTVASTTISSPPGFSSSEISASASISSRQSGSSSEDFKWPFSLSDVTSEFGPRPPLPFHRGIDFGEPSGTPIPAAHNGTIILRGYYDDWGNYTRVSCSELTGVSNSWTGYAHMRALPLNPVGTVVSQGQTLGYVGSTGLSTGPHLHWETALEGIRIDPRQFMGIFGGSGTTFTEVQARLRINGVTSPVFKPYLDMGLSSVQLNFPIYGRSMTNQSEITVELQMRSVGGRITRNPATVASMSIRGGFSI